VNKYKFDGRMIIFDNIVFSLQRSGGISSIWSHILEAALGDDALSVGCIDYDNDNVFRQRLNINEKNIIKKIGQIGWGERYLSPTIRKDLLTDSRTLFHSSYYRTMHGENVVNITTVHDFVYEKFMSGVRQKVHSWQKRKAVLDSDVIVCVSENTKKDLLQYIPECRDKDVRVIHNGVSDSFRLIEGTPCPEYSDCVLFVGSRAGYKNFNLAVDFVAQSNYRLLICGDPLTYSERKRLRERLGDKRFVSLDNVSASELNKLYNSVYCLAYPSSYEGFGLPVIEAQRAHCPVIALNASSIPEIIGGDYPMMSSPTLSEFIRVANEFLPGRAREQILVSGHTNSLRFSLQSMTSRDLSLYHSLLS
jgi:mannosyltransferase